jgi:23S rRNA (cytidine1920-2'-O)/16S rRNA (cytidine1409-2'-O)-methyltransferase
VAKVCAVDVGTLQLHEKIRQDMRVESFENTDIRDFAQKSETYSFDFIFCDVSFISLELILESVLQLKKTHTKVALLYKPQYEVGKNNLTKLGVPKSQEIIDAQLAHFCLILKEK